MKDKKVHFYGKLAKFPDGVKAHKAINFLENIKISKKKLWYILVEKDENELQMIKYNNKSGHDLRLFVEELKRYYSNREDLVKYIDQLIIEGKNEFSVIKNIPDVDTGNGKKLISLLTEDLIRLLSN